MIADSTNPIDILHNERLDAERKAWEAMAKYKFWMFGYWAGAWVKYNRILGQIDKTQKLPNPFIALVKLARDNQEK